MVLLPEPDPYYKNFYGSGSGSVKIVPAAPAPAKLSGSGGFGSATLVKRPSSGHELHEQPSEVMLNYPYSWDHVSLAHIRGVNLDEHNAKVETVR